MTKSQIAQFLNIDVKTFRNWKKTRPNLYKIIMQGFKFDDVLKQSRKNYEDMIRLKDKEAFQWA